MPPPTSKDWVGVGYGVIEPHRDGLHGSSDVAENKSDNNFSSKDQAGATASKSDRADQTLLHDENSVAFDPMLFASPAKSGRGVAGAQGDCMDDTGNYDTNVFGTNIRST